MGGFTGGDPEKKNSKPLVRWFEWGTFCPVMRLHGDRCLPAEEVVGKDGLTCTSIPAAPNEVLELGRIQLPDSYVIYPACGGHATIRKLTEGSS